VFPVRYELGFHIPEDDVLHRLLTYRSVGTLSIVVTAIQCNIHLTDRDIRINSTHTCSACAWTLHLAFPTCTYPS
jgi:hypothetical protein